jgi:hypothetical protein
MSLTQGDMVVLMAYIDQDREATRREVSKSTAQFCRQSVCPHCKPVYHLSAHTLIALGEPPKTLNPIEFDHTRGVWTHQVPRTQLREYIVPMRHRILYAICRLMGITVSFKHPTETITVTVDCPASEIINKYQLELPKPKEGMGINTAAYSEPYTDAYGGGE